MSEFKDVSENWNREDGGERWVMTLSQTCWVSVLHRMTGFGYMEWESALCYSVERPDGKRSIDCRVIVRGDHRTTLEGMTQENVETWFSIPDRERISFDTVMAAMKAATVENE